MMSRTSKRQRRSKEHFHEEKTSVGSNNPHMPVVETFQIDYCSAHTVPNISANSGLAELIFPVSVECFVDEFFQPYKSLDRHPTAKPSRSLLPQTAVHFTCKRGQSIQHRRRVENLVEKEMLGLDPKRLFDESSSDSIFIWLRPQTSSQSDDNSSEEKHPFVQSIELTDVSSALALLQCGHASYCRAPPDVEQPLVSRLLKDTGLGCGQYDPSGNSNRCLGRGEVEVFITSSSSSPISKSSSSSGPSANSLHVTDWHFDFQENFTVQLSGTKRWTLQSGTIPFPLRACTPHYASPSTVEGQLQAAHLVDRKFQFSHPQVNINAFGEAQSILVQPGDVLYFPAGMWHKVECIEPGVSINISLMATNYANLVCQSLQHILLQRDDWRRPVACPPERPNNVLEHLQQLLHDLPEIITILKEKNNLSQCILPPVLRFPPKFTSSVHEEDNADDEETAENDDLEDNQETERPGQSVISVCEFVATEDWSDGRRSDSNYFLVKNPLACLTCMDEISYFYSNGPGKEEDAKSMFVLHVNFAGNEGLESSIRVILRDDDKSKCLNRLYESLEKVNKSDSCARPPRDVLNDSSFISNNVRMIECMLFHGYLEWRSKEASA